MTQMKENLRYDRNNFIFVEPVMMKLVPHDNARVLSILSRCRVSWLREVTAIVLCQNVCQRNLIFISHGKCRIFSIHLRDINIIILY